MNETLEVLQEEFKFKSFTDAANTAIRLIDPIYKDHLYIDWPATYVLFQRKYNQTYNNALDIYSDVTAGEEFNASEVIFWDRMKDFAFFMSSQDPSKPEMIPEKLLQESSISQRLFPISPDQTTEEQLDKFIAIQITPKERILTSISEAYNDLSPAVRYAAAI